MNLLTAFFSTLGRLARVVLFLMLFLAMLAIGLCVAAGVLLWSLVTGRRPAIMQMGSFQRAAQFRSQFRSRFGAQAGAAGRSPFGAPGFGTAPARGEVVDVEVREVPNADPRLGR